MPRHTDPADGLFAERYRLLGLLGSGGDASVFRAHDERTGRTVALKVLHAHLGAVAGASEVFLTRARQAASVRHPSLAAVLAFGVDDAAGFQPWIALELISGRTLRDEIEARGPLPTAEAAALLGHVLDGLDALHASGLVHRDVTPANIMVDSTGAEPRAVLLDLGLAAPAGERAAEPDGPDAGAPVLVRGTVDWMSPEQILGDPVDGRADLYQAAAVLYFALTGEAPFPRDSTEAVQRAHLSAPPPAASARTPGVPRAVDRVIAHAMLKRPDARPRDARELLLGLQTALPGQHRDLPTDRVPDGEPAPTARYPLPAPLPDDSRTLLLSRAARAPEPLSTAPASNAGRRLLVPVVVLVAVVGLGAVWFMASTSTRSAAVAPPSTTSASVPPAASTAPEPSPTMAAAPVVETVTIPVVVGGTADDVAGMLALHGLVLGEVSTAPSASAARIVLSSTPAAGTAVQPGTVVTVVIASGENAVPPVVGLGEAAAAAGLRDAGFAVAVTTASGNGPVAAPAAPAAPDPAGAALVVASFPAEGTLLPLGQTVTITREAPATTATPTPTPSTPAPVPVPTTTPSASGAASIRDREPHLVKASFTLASSPVHEAARACGRDTGSDGRARR